MKNFNPFDNSDSSDFDSDMSVIESDDAFNDKKRPKKVEIMEAEGLHDDEDYEDEDPDYVSPVKRHYSL